MRRLIPFFVVLSAAPFAFGEFICISTETVGNPSVEEAMLVDLWNTTHPAYTLTDLEYLGKWEFNDGEFDASEDGSVDIDSFISDFEFDGGSDSTGFWSADGEVFAMALKSGGGTMLCVWNDPLSGATSANFATFDGRALSHATFFTYDVAIPEPNALFVGMIGVVGGLLAMRRRR